MTLLVHNTGPSQLVALVDETDPKLTRHYRTWERVPMVGELVRLEAGPCFHVCRVITGDVPARADRRSAPVGYYRNFALVLVVLTPHVGDDGLMCEPTDDLIIAEPPPLPNESTTKGAPLPCG